MFNNHSFIFQLLTTQGLPWFFLAIAIIYTFIKPKFWLLGLVITLAVGLFYNAINLVGLSVISVLLALSYLANKAKNKHVKVTCVSMVALACIALFAHLIPGFNNLLVLDGVSKSASSSAITLYLNFDKPMVLFTLLCMYPTILNKQTPLIIISNLNTARLALLVVVSFCFIFLLASVLSLITFDVGLPDWFLLFALNNLLLTCVIEEVFFRGFIQRSLQQTLEQKFIHRFKQKYSALISLVITSALFGLAHFSGGFYYVIVAMFAGLLYGFIYQCTGKITYAIFTHFLLNFIHLTLFTYPLYKPLM